MNFFLFHCWGGDGKSCWSAWLSEELQKQGHTVISPDFPNTNIPHLTEWLASIRDKVKRFDKNWVLVGHSLGCPTILRLLESMGKDESVHTVVLVAGFGKDLGIAEIRNFVQEKFDWDKIRSKAGHFIVISSDNDPFIKLSEGERLAKMLGANFIVEHNKGHLNDPYYPQLLKILSELKPPVL